MSNRITLTLSIRNVRTRFWSISNISFLWAFAKCYSNFTFPCCESWGSKQEWPNMESQVKGPEKKKKGYLHRDLLAAKRLCPWLGFIVTSMIDIAPASTILNICLCHQERWTCESSCHAGLAMLWEMHLNHLNLNHSISKEDKKKSDKSDRKCRNVLSFKRCWPSWRPAQWCKAIGPPIGKHTKIASDYSDWKIKSSKVQEVHEVFLFQKPLLCRRIVDNRLEDACGRLMPAPFSANQRKTTSRGTCSNVVHAGPNLISTCWIAYVGFAHSVYYLPKPRGFSQGTTALQLPPMRSMEMW